MSAFENFSLSLSSSGDRNPLLSLSNFFILPAAHSRILGSTAGEEVPLAGLGDLADGVGVEGALVAAVELLEALLAPPGINPFFTATKHSFIVMYPSYLSQISKSRRLRLGSISC